MSRRYVRATHQGGLDIVPFKRSNVGPHGNDKKGSGNKREFHLLM